MEMKVHLDVGGKLFTTTTETLASLPLTRLGKLAEQAKEGTEKSIELFFDRNPEIMNSVLDLYRTGELHLPETLCSAVAARELEFWEIPTTLIHQCCWRKFENHQSDAAIVKEIDQFLHDPYDNEKEIQKLSVWNKIWFGMEHPFYSIWSKIWTIIYYTLVFTTVLWFTLETVLLFREYTDRFIELATPYTGANTTLDDVYDSLDFIEKFVMTQPRPWLRVPQMCMFGFFALEFLIKLMTCPNKAEFLRQPRTWCEVVLLTLGGLSLVIEYHVLKMKTVFTVAEANALLFCYVLTMIRSLRIIYLAKHSETMKMFILSAKSSMKELVMLVICVLTFVTMFGSLAYVTEIVTKDYTFHSIPHGMWWAIVTMTTVGYGDVAPVGVYGQLVGAVCTLLGVIVLALPIAVIAAKFSSYHDNLNARRQMRARMTFLLQNPYFDWKNSDDVSTVKDVSDKKDNTTVSKKTPQNTPKVKDTAPSTKGDRVTSATAWSTNSSSLSIPDDVRGVEAELIDVISDNLQKPVAVEKEGKASGQAVAPSALNMNRGKVHHMD